MAEKSKRDISKLSKIELVEMLQRQEKLLQNGKFLKSLPDKGQKIHDMVKMLKEMIIKRGQTEDLTARFQQISIHQSRDANQTQDLTLDSDDDEDTDYCTAISNMDNDNIDSAEKKSQLSASSREDSKKPDKWSYESAVTYERKPKFEKIKQISLEESIKLQQAQKNEYEALRTKQATERLMQHRNPTSSCSNLKFTTQEAKDHYRDTVKEEEIQEDDTQSESDDIQQQEESDED
ncbi:DNA-directed RNA polymerase II subunit GRINL1A [Exaiptasia diaphana]|uniref:DNA-directed RNA polymerase II subunit GRINL1A n=1 Tax=Exaiptasia diaphana TaxID=2652724 RepID=A0A913Y7T4_EXADI|nr:DNA-directed RNA polymerase II subunit GRINL1A [Exaiptasia diaphana]KXJ28799.1 DNA-directed RNA polymerase II subunit GRINL1A [Exaiptasia diaphana]